MSLPLNSSLVRNLMEPQPLEETLRVRIGPALKAELADLAAEHSRSVSGEARAALALWVRTYKTRERREHDRAEAASE